MNILSIARKVAGITEMFHNSLEPSTVLKINNELVEPGVVGASEIEKVLNRYNLSYEKNNGHLVKGGEVFPLSFLPFVGKYAFIRNYELCIKNGTGSVIKMKNPRPENLLKITELLGPFTPEPIED